MYNLLGSLTGTAWKVVERLADAQTEADTAFDEILDIDKSFRYDDRVLNHYFN